MEQRREFVDTLQRNASWAAQFILQKFNLRVLKNVMIYIKINRNVICRLVFVSMEIHDD